MADPGPPPPPDEFRYPPLAPAPPVDPVDPVGVVAVAAGFVGILFFGLLMALVTAILGALTGQRARDAGQSLQQAYLALFMALADGMIWLVLHLVFEMPFWLG